MGTTEKDFVLISPVSTQVFPVVVTALTLKPLKVILLTTPKVDTFADLIEKALILSGIEVERRTIDPYSVFSIECSVKGVKNPVFLLNCGTKFTAINLYKLSGGKNTYYYLPSGYVVDFNGRKLLKVPDNLIDVEFHARMYGFEIVEERLDYEKIELRQELTQYIATRPSLTSVLVRLFQKGHVKNVSLQDREFLTLAQKYGVVSYRGGKFFAEDREYIGGKWLEEFVFLKLLSSGFFDVRIGVKVKWYGEDVTNEIDVMATRKNRLYLFSCKTGKNTREILKHLYELEELTERIGGDFGKSYLVITKNLYAPEPPRRSEFPNAPSVSYRENRKIWQEYYRTPEGREFRKFQSNYAGFRNLSKRAKLLGIKILLPEDLEGGNVDQTLQAK